MYSKTNKSDAIVICTEEKVIENKEQVEIEKKKVVVESEVSR